MAYPNKTINDGPYGSFMADPGQADIAIYARCKFVDPTTVTPDGKPLLQVCSATERADVVAMQQIPAGSYGTVKFANAPGEFFGFLPAGTAAIASAAAVYGAASGGVGNTGGGALLIGKATSTGVANGVITYTTNIPAA